MEEIRVNSRELLYIASFTEADEFIGIPDGFYGMDEAEIAAEINEIKNSLVGKGYSEMDFDGEFNITQEVFEVINACAMCKQYIAFDRVNAASKKSLRYYINDENIYFAVNDGDEWLIQTADGLEIEESILTEILCAEDICAADTKITENAVFIENSLFNRIKEMNELGNELEAVGCDSIAARLLYKGAVGEADYYSIAAIDYEAKENQINTMMFISDDVAAIEIIPSEKGEQYGVKILSASYISLTEKLRLMLSEIVPKGAFE